MTRSEHYQYAQQNLLLLEKEISMVKKSAQALIGKFAWQQANNQPAKILDASRFEVLAATRLYTFLICSWLEARLTKIFYENSSCAFTDIEIELITNPRHTMEYRWKASFSLAVQKSYRFSSYPNLVHDYSSDFTPGSLSLTNYQLILSLFEDLADAITIRNRLAHGQWAVQFNSNNTHIKQYSLIQNYDNIQKLENLKGCFNQIGEILSMYVTYKDKQNPNFDQIVNQKLKLIIDKKLKAEKMDYSKYISSLKRSYQAMRQRIKSATN